MKAYIWDNITGKQWGYIEGNQVVCLSGKRYDLVGLNLVDPDTGVAVLHLEPWG